MNAWMRRILALHLVALATLVTIGVAMVGAVAQPDVRHRIMMVTFRGCEDACQGFIEYVTDSPMDAHVEVHDIDRDRSLLPDLVRLVRDDPPDLLVTWGTSVTLGMIGEVDARGDQVVTDVPTVFMIVADPIGAGIIESYGASGREHVTGTRNRVPEETQLRVLADYRPFGRLGLIYNDDELNAQLKADEVRRVTAEQGIVLEERVVAEDDEGVPLVSDIGVAVHDLADRGVDFLYVASSSFLLDNADVLTRSAVEAGLPLATAYEAMVRESDALIALASPYYNVGQLAGFQAEQILHHGKPASELEVVGLDRFTLVVNMETARRLRLYPPMLLLRYAEVV